MNDSTIVLQGVCSIDALQPLLQQAQRAAGLGQDVDVRCQDVEHVHSAVVQVLAALAAALEKTGHKLVCSERAAALDSALSLTGLSGLL